MTTPPLFDGRSFAALLFDMDGTVLSSIEATERVWTRWAARFGLDVRTVLHDIHGRRAVDSVQRLNIPGMDAAAEAAELTRLEMEEVEGVHPISGVHEFLRSLPAGGWGIVTSAPRALAVRKLEAAGLEVPPVLITADDIPIGKPDPSCYQMAANHLGVNVADCVVFEDAVAGIQAGEAAGAKVIVITATHAQPMPTNHPAFRNFDGLRAQITQGRMKIINRS
jgi:mannitol-1-/sugar-/sorbitol-6-phosphatase